MKRLLAEAVINVLDWLVKQQPRTNVRMSMLQNLMIGQICSEWLPSFKHIKLYTVVWIYCQGQTDVRGNEQTEWLEQGTSGKHRHLGKQKSCNSLEKHPKQGYH